MQKNADSKDKKASEPANPDKMELLYNRNAATIQKDSADRMNCLQNKGIFYQRTENFQTFPKNKLLFYI